MSDAQHDHPSEGENEAAEGLRDALDTLLDSAPAPEPRLSDEELLAEIRRAAAESTEDDPPM
uniref:Uncharacterized protein n=1 Tax=Streptomyces sp. NBC_01401 TaxID=2903854 RepID=A0AAU3GTF4_9ACTN